MLPSMIRFATAAARAVARPPAGLAPPAGRSLVPTSRHFRSLSIPLAAGGPCLPAEDNSMEYKKELAYQLMRAKEESGKSFDEIAKEIGLTNCDTAQLFHNQAKLTDATAAKLMAAVPTLTEEHIAVMKRAPMRMWDKDILMEPNVYRTQEAIAHYGESIKALVNEQLGDGIMSAIDFFMTVEKIKGKEGEDRVVITFNGKFLPYREQRTEDNTAATGAK